VSRWRGSWVLYLHEGRHSSLDWDHAYQRIIIQHIVRILAMLFGVSEMTVLNDWCSHRSHLLPLGDEGGPDGAISVANEDGQTSAGDWRVAIRRTKTAKRE
jgi:hypothetical protein